jgi:signal transduction histidine kinase
MDKTTQTLLNGYEQPVILSDANDGNIVFVNDAAKKELGLSQLSDTKLFDLFHSQRIIRENVIWERGKQQFEITEEKIVIDGQPYIKASLAQVDRNKMVDLIEIQQEMAKLLVHRIHSPLNGVAGFTELLKDMNLTQKQKRYINSIEEGLDDLKHILSRIHDLAEDIEVQISSIDAQDFAQKIIDQYPPDKKKNISLTVDSELVELKSDFVLLKDIITELLDNALEFGNTQQGVELHFRNDAKIRVTSYGSQIPKSFIQKMYYPFFSNKARGVGLGLSKCIRYTRELGYKIELSENSNVDGISFDILMK